MIISINIKALLHYVITEGPDILTVEVYAVKLINRKKGFDVGYQEIFSLKMKQK